MFWLNWTPLALVPMVTELLPLVSPRKMVLQLAMSVGPPITSKPDRT